MNQQQFHDTFPSWEKEYKKFQSTNENKKKHKEEKMKFDEFTKMYPTLSFNDLQIQNNNYSMDDGCIHYKNLKNNQIYSWNFIENEWEQHSIEYQNELLDLFTN